MKEIVRALIAQRKAIDLGAPVVYAEVTDLNVTSLPMPHGTLQVQTAHSEVPAVVPFTLTEKIYVQSDDPKSPTLDTIIDALLLNVGGKAFFGADATIHRMIWAGTAYNFGTGSTREATIKWYGTASWRPR